VETLEVMERVEDEAVIQELRGEVIETLVYEFNDGIAGE
jgi:hypothetical protein